MPKEQEFSIQVNEWVTKTKGNFDKFMLEFTQDIAEEVIKLSPVDTGFFRSSWTANIGRADIAFNAGGRPEGFERISEQQAATESLSRITLNLAGIKGGNTVYITNNVEYGPKLEAGFSKKAPSGMIGPTVNRANTIANKVISRLKK